MKREAYLGPSTVIPSVIENIPPPELPDDHKVCTACGEPMWPADRFCADCGQKAYDGPPGFWEMLGEFFETVFSLDNRLFRTLKNLVFPGRLTNRFLAGKQRPYFQPLRLFFISSVLMVGAFTIVATDAIGDQMEEQLERRRSRAYHNLFADKLEKNADSLRTSFPEPVINLALDSLETLFGQKKPDSLHIGYLPFSRDNRDQIISFAQEDYMLLSPDELMKKYGIEDWLEQYQIKQILRLNRVGVNGVASLMGQLVWGLVLLMPVTALLLKLVYIRRKRKYVEHFIFSLHVHAFFFLVMFLGALELYFFTTPYIVAIGQVGVAVYFVLSLKKVYDQGWGKTILKAWIMSMGYLFLLVFVVSITALISAALF